MERKGSPQGATEQDRWLEWATAVAQGDRSAFQLIYQRFSTAVQRFFVRRGARDVDALANDVWVDAWNALSAGRYDPARGKLSTFLYAIAWRTLLRHKRAQSRGPQPLSVDELALRLLGGESDPTRLTEFSDLLDDLNRCIGRPPFDDGDGGLDDQDRLILNAIYFEGMTERACAAKLECAPSTVHKRCQRVLRRLAACLKRKGHGSIS